MKSQAHIVFQRLIDYSIQYSRCVRNVWKMRWQCIAYRVYVYSNRRRQQSCSLTMCTNCKIYFFRSPSYTKWQSNWFQFSASFKIRVKRLQHHCNRSSLVDRVSRHCSFALRSHIRTMKIYFWFARFALLIRIQQCISNRINYLLHHNPHSIYCLRRVASASTAFDIFPAQILHVHFLSDCSTWCTSCLLCQCCPVPKYGACLHNRLIRG